MSGKSRRSRRRRKRRRRRELEKTFHSFSFLPWFLMALHSAVQRMRMLWEFGRLLPVSLSLSHSLSLTLSQPLMVTRRKKFFAKNNNFLKLILKGKTGSYRPTEGTTVTTKVRSIRKRDQTIKFSVFPVVHGPLLWAYGRLYYGRAVLKAAYKGQNQTDAGRERGRP